MSMDEVSTMNLSVLQDLYSLGLTKYSVFLLPVSKQRWKLSLKLQQIQLRLQLRNRLRNRQKRLNSKPGMDQKYTATRV